MDNAFHFLAMITDVAIIWMHRCLLLIDKSNTSLGILSASQGERQKLLGLKADLAAIAIISSGDDYLPALLGVQLKGRTPEGRPALWET